MHHFTKGVLQRLKDKGVTLDPLQAMDDLVELERRAQQISERPVHYRFDELERPIYVGGVAFWPPSIGCFSWSRKFGDWFPDDMGLQDMALLFSLAHAREIQSINEQDDPPSARRKVLRWAGKTNLSTSQAREVIELLIPRPREMREQLEMAALRMANGDNEKTWPEAALRSLVRWWLKEAARMEEVSKNTNHTGDLITACMETYGGDFNYWIFEVSQNRLLQAADGIRQRNEQEADASSGKSTVPSWKVDAQGRFNTYARAFEAKYSPKPGPGAP